MEIGRRSASVNLTWHPEFHAETRHRLRFFRAQSGRGPCNSGVPEWGYGGAKFVEVGVGYLPRTLLHQKGATLTGSTYARERSPRRSSAQSFYGMNLEFAITQKHGMKTVQQRDPGRSIGGSGRYRNHLQNPILRTRLITRKLILRVELELTETDRLNGTVAAGHNCRPEHSTASDARQTFVRNLRDAISNGRDKINS